MPTRELLVKCPFCNSPVMLHYRSETEERYRCTVCWKQTVELLESVDPDEEVEEDLGDHAA